LEEKKKRILVVDDDPTLIKMIKIYFENLGFSISLAGSGVEALKAFDEEPPDVMILDIRMPGMDGIKVCRKIRLEKGNLKTPIIAITGYHNEKIKKDVMAAGANAYMEKPLDLSRLLKIVKELISDNPC